MPTIIEHFSKKVMIVDLFTKDLAPKLFNEHVVRMVYWAMFLVSGTIGMMALFDP